VRAIFFFTTQENDSIASALMKNKGSSKQIPSKHSNFEKLCNKPLSIVSKIHGWCMRNGSNFEMERVPRNTTVLLK
jgi:hypothetical protein